MIPNADHALLHAYLRRGVAGQMASSPLLEALGASLDHHDSKTGQLRMTFAPAPMFRQGAGVVQGGALAAMLDYVMAFAGMAAVGAERSVTTTSMTTNFLASATDITFHATGEIEKAGRRLVFVRARLEAGDKAVASASSTLLVL
jgi:uncharacterized protein (TIGR00369 family)